VTKGGVESHVIYRIVLKIAMTEEHVLEENVFVIKDLVVKLVIL